MARNAYSDTYTELDEVDVDETELDAEDGVEVDGDVEAWINDMLSSPSSYDY